MKKYIDIQNEVIATYRIHLCNGECKDGDWSRTHAHVKERKVCKWKRANSMASTFDLFHEIGHIMTTTGGMRRCESEYVATIWAIDLCERYKLSIPEKLLNDYQEYVYMEYDRGIRRNGKNYAPKSELNLITYYKNKNKEKCA